MVMIPLVRMICKYIPEFITRNNFTLFVVSPDSVLLDNKKCLIWVRRSWGGASFSVVNRPVVIGSNLYSNVGVFLSFNRNQKAPISIDKTEKFLDQRDQNTYESLILEEYLWNKFGNDILRGEDGWKQERGGEVLLGEYEVRDITQAFARGPVSCSALDNL